MIDYNKVYDILNLKNDETNYDRFELYYFIRFLIEDDDLDNNIIEELYDCYCWLNQENYNNSLSINEYVEMLRVYLERLKISIKNIDLDEFVLSLE